jgi:hypothetical protein
MPDKIVGIDEGKIAVWLMVLGIVIALAIALYVYLPPYLKAKDDIAMYELARDLHDAEYNKMLEFFSVYKKCQMIEIHSRSRSRLRIGALIGNQAPDC